MEIQFLNFKSTELDKPIYKVLKFDYLVEMFQNNLNTLLNPSIWDDPYENLFMDSTIEFVNGLSLKSELGKSMFCQSWSFTKESDAMWRIYSPDNNSVKISSTPRKLLKSLTEIDENSNKVFVGKVKYLKSIDLKSLYLNNSKKWLFEEFGIGNAKSLLYKRYPFEHENEVRLIYNTFRNEEKQILKYPINPNLLIDKIVFDPRLEYSKFRNRKTEIKNLGFNKEIIKSNLYKMPIYNIIK
ncbi:DUF2971 domain-containing protein [Flavobacterium psychrophilum]|uniref:DUF2971 domain-containing protein n=1 Tax=Flavobacterium psychrophilum TaxID=96345 RepID=UPI001153A413|nr:DUF2971 domain-containing protein [Flavobacterium psychrophilum]EKT3967423.1 DUF2971 domain-containing protein [Flavobacterium psychrophilum]GEJ38992.1 hypothetical protein FPN184_contig00089-0001 [Flavobacterium psychrophilum]GEJ50235.1 hypothetical protein FPKKA176_contig00071-0001 [Flavobacterium psychrophilum]